MDYVLQVHEAKYIFPIPNGLKELSSDIIREVLRHQPEHINGFIADYLETMLVVRENTRDAGVVVCDVFREGYFFDELYKTKNINRVQANAYATVIQANWRGYVVRRKIAEWLKKKKKFEEEKERKRSLKIEELLAGLGITYNEATRAAGIIQSAYKESKRGKWISGDFGEVWVGESIPFGQRIREGDRALGRFNRWEKQDFGDFFEIDESGIIKYNWPRVGQLQKVLREEIPNDVGVVEFFGMRDLQGQEQYSYLIKTQVGTETRGAPIGFLIPLSKLQLTETATEVQFVNSENAEKMGPYTYIFRDDVERDDLVKFGELLATHAKTSLNAEIPGEFDYDPHWVLPRALIRIKQEFLQETDIEVKFVSLPNVVCDDESYAFRAETLPQTAKIIRHILRDKCLTVEEGLAEAANLSPYRIQETGRIFPVDSFTNPQYVQKLIIPPESNTGEEESTNLEEYTYIFVPLEHHMKKKYPKGESPITIPIARFQGYHADYKGSSALENKVFIMGPRMTTPNGKPFTYESLFWEEFGLEAWHQLLYNISSNIEELTGEEAAEEEEMVPEVIEEEYYSEKVPVVSSQTEEKETKPSTESEALESAPIIPEGGEIEKISPLLPPPVDESLEAEGEGKPPLKSEDQKEEDKTGDIKEEDKTGEIKEEDKTGEIKEEEAPTVDN